MNYVYLLSTHDEYGAEDVRATLCRDDLIGLAKDFANRRDASQEYGQRLKGWAEEAEAMLRALLEKPDDELANLDGDSGGAMPHSLNYGWGGMQLHVVPLACAK